MMNRENALAATWATTYSVSLILVVAAFEHLGISPFYSVPFVVVILPFAVALLLSPLQRHRPGGGS